MAIRKYIEQKDGKGGVPSNSAPSPISSARSVTFTFSDEEIKRIYGDEDPPEPWVPNGSVIVDGAVFSSKEARMMRHMRSFMSDQPERYNAIRSMIIKAKRLMYDLDLEVDERTVEKVAADERKRCL